MLVKNHYNLHFRLCCCCSPRISICSSFRMRNARTLWTLSILFIATETTTATWHDIKPACFRLQNTIFPQTPRENSYACTERIDNTYIRSSSQKDTSLLFTSLPLQLKRIFQNITPLTSTVWSPETFSKHPWL